MSDSISIRVLRENMILALLAQGPRPVGELTREVEFTRHDSRTRKLLFGLDKTNLVGWDQDGDWSITREGLSRLQQMRSA